MQETCSGDTVFANFFVQLSSEMHNTINACFPEKKIFKEQVFKYYTRVFIKKQLLNNLVI